MNNQENIYDKNEFASQMGLRIMFISQGVEDVIKLVDYEFVEESNNRKQKIEEDYITGKNIFLYY